MFVVTDESDESIANRMMIVESDQTALNRKRATVNSGTLRARVQVVCLARDGVAIPGVKTDGERKGYPIECDV